MYKIVHIKYNGYYEVHVSTREAGGNDPIFMTKDIREAMQMVSFLNGGEEPVWLAYYKFSS